MRSATMINELHDQRKKFMLDTTPTDRIIEEDFYSEYSTFVTSAGGDYTTYRVYGKKPGEFRCYIK